MDKKGDTVTPGKKVTVVVPQCVFQDAQKKPRPGNLSRAQRDWERLVLSRSPQWKKRNPYGKATWCLAEDKGGSLTLICEVGLIPDRTVHQIIEDWIINPKLHNAPGLQLLIAGNRIHETDVEEVMTRWPFFLWGSNEGYDTRRKTSAFSGAAQ